MRSSNFQWATLLVLLLIFGGAGCSASQCPDDFDCDGATDDVDCGPDDETIHPGARDESVDGTDQDCDGIDGPVPDDDDSTADDDDDSTGDDDSADDDDSAPGDDDSSGPDDDDTPVDGDGDGFPAGEDCDDADPAVHPGAAEACDGQDNDCDGSTDEDFDLDGDGAFDGAVPACADTYGAMADCDDSDPEHSGMDADLDGFSPCTDDCNESNAASYPGAPDPWGDGIDQSCNGIDGVDWDGDGWPGNAAPPDVGTPAWDCDDYDASLNRDDADGDGEDPCEGDCSDAEPTINTTAVEVCDFVDDDCDGDLSEDFPDLDGDGTADCIDLDADGDGSEGALGSGDDCDDLDGNAHPGQLVFIGSPSAGTGTFDYNCDGVVEQERTLLSAGIQSCYSCSGGEPTGPVFTAGWLDCVFISGQPQQPCNTLAMPPDCGEVVGWAPEWTGNCVTCPAGEYAGGVPSETTQACR